MKKIFFLFAIFSFIFISYEANAKPRKKQSRVNPTVLAQYFLQINLTKSDCEKYVDHDCVRRDQMRDELYYHETQLKIFNGKIFAEQIFEAGEKSGVRMFYKVKDGFYKIKDDKENLISFVAKNGQVSKLQLIKGNLAREKKPESKCDLTNAIYGFYQAYDPERLLVKSGRFEDEDDFKGLQEFLVFVEKSNHSEVMVMTNKENQTPVAAKDLGLCQRKEATNYFVKHVKEEDCKDPNSDMAVECSKYSDCDDYLVVKNCDVVLLKDAMN